MYGTVQYLLQVVYIDYIFFYLFKKVPSFQRLNYEYGIYVESIKYNFNKQKSKSSTLHKMDGNGMLCDSDSKI